MNRHDPSRRRFLTLAGAAAGAVALAPLVAACEAAPPAGPSALSIPEWQRGITGVVTTDALVLAAAGGARVQHARGNARRIDLAVDEAVVASYGAESDPTIVNRVSDAAFAPDGTIWFVDRGNARLLHLTAELAPLPAVASIDGVALRSPAGVDALPDGRIVVTDTRGGVAIVDPSGTGRWLHRAADGSAGPAASVPREIAVSGTGAVLVHDRTNRRSGTLLEIDPSTATAKSITTPDDRFIGMTPTAEGALALFDGDVVRAITPTSRSLGGVSNSAGHSFSNAGGTITAAIVSAANPGSSSIRRITFDRSTGELIVSLPVPLDTSALHSQGDPPTTPEH